MAHQGTGGALAGRDKVCVHVFTISVAAVVAWYVDD